MPEPLEPAHRIAWYPSSRVVIAGGGPERTFGGFAVDTVPGQIFQVV